MTIKRWKAAVAALAPAWATDHFRLCVSGFDCDLLYIEGSITWGNRTASVVVYHHNYGANLSGHFTAYAGSTKVDNEVTYGTTQFFIGNPNLPGGIDRIRSVACVGGDGGASACSTRPWYDIRD